MKRVTCHYNKNINKFKKTARILTLEGLKKYPI